MWPFKRDKFKNLKREDVVNAIIELEKQESEIEKGILEKTKQIDEYIKKGRAEKSPEIKLFYAKKVAHLQEEKKEDVNRGMYLLYNSRLMNKLKNAIDDNSFYINAGKVSLNNLLSDQKNLAKFLNKALNTKVLAEDVLTEADDTFNEVKSLYEENDKIYGVNSADDDILALMEAGETDGIEVAEAVVEEEKKAVSLNEEE